MHKPPKFKKLKRSSIFPKKSPQRKRYREKDLFITGSEKDFKPMTREVQDTTQEPKERALLAQELSILPQRVRWEREHLSTSLNKDLSVHLSKPSGDASFAKTKSTWQ